MSHHLSAYGFKEIQQRGSVEDPNTPISEAIDWLDASGTKSGRTVGLNSALHYHAVWRAVDLIAKDIAKINLFVYERQGDQGKQRATTHPAYRLLRKKPNRWQTHYAFFHMLTAHLTLAGNAYAFIDRNRNGVPVELLPLDPQSVTVVREAGEVWYWIRTSDLNLRISAADILHLKRFSWDGLVGLNPVQYAREILGVGLSGTDYQASFFKNSGKPSAVLETDHTLKDEEFKRVRDSWNAAYSGANNAHKVAILEHGLSLKPFSVNAKDAQVLELLQDNTRAVANIFNLPPHKLGDTTRTSFASLEQENQAYLDDTLDPILVNWEQELDCKILSASEREADTHFIEFDRKALMRADLGATGEFLNKALQGHPWITVNEARGVMNMNALEGHDVIAVPTNNFGTTNAVDTTDDNEDIAAANTDEQARAFVAVAQQTALRLWRRMVPAAKKEAKKDAPDFPGITERWINEFTEELAPVAQGLRAIGLDADAIVDEWNSALIGCFLGTINDTGTRTPEVISSRLQDKEIAFVAKIGVE